MSLSSIITILVVIVIVIIALKLLSGLLRFAIGLAIVGFLAYWVYHVFVLHQSMAFFLK